MRNTFYAATPNRHTVDKCAILVTYGQRHHEDRVKNVAAAAVKQPVLTKCSIDKSRIQWFQFNAKCRQIDCTAPQRHEGGYRVHCNATNYLFHFYSNCSETDQVVLVHTINKY